MQPSKDNKKRFGKKARSDKKGLTQRQYLFCEYYLQIGVAAAAYIKAGYSQNNKYSGSSELLANPKIKAYLARARKSRHSNFLLSYEDAMKRLSKLAKGLTKEEVIVIEGSGDGFSTAKVMKKKVDARVQFAAIKEVITLHEKTETIDSVHQSTDDRLYKAMKRRVADSTKVNIPTGVQYEEDEELNEVLESPTPEEGVVEHVS